MAESSSQNPSSPNITPKEEPDTQERPESLNPFLHANQVEFTFAEITFSTNNEFWYTAKTLEDSKIWVSTPIGGIRGEIGPPFTDHMKAIYNADVPVESQALKTSSRTKKKVPQGKNPGAISGLRRKQSSKHTSESKTEASKSKTSQSYKETQSSSAKDKSPSHPSTSTPVVAEMHKEAQQAAGGPTSLGATSEEGSHPQLSSGMSAFILIKPIYSASFIFTLSLHQDVMLQTNPSVLVDKTKSAGDGLKTAHTDLDTNEESRSDDISKKIKLEDLSNLMQDTRSTFFSPDSLEDEPIIITNESEEEEAERYEV
ncbi:hypothetical protein Tco_1214752 [Tanacetum coccineum]